MRMKRHRRRKHQSLQRVTLITDISNGDKSWSTEIAGREMEVLQRRRGDAEIDGVVSVSVDFERKAYEGGIGRSEDGLKDSRDDVTCENTCHRF
jgi:hypothetical protein